MRRVVPEHRLVADQQVGDAKGGVGDQVRVNIRMEAQVVADAETDRDRADDSQQVDDGFRDAGRKRAGRQWRARHAIRRRSLGCRA